MKADGCAPGTVAGACRGDAAREAGVTFRRLDYWSRLGLLRPAQGAGWARRLWSPAEVEIARRMGVLTAAGLTPAAAGAFARDAWPAGEIAPGITLAVSP